MTDKDADSAEVSEPTLFEGHHPGVDWFLAFLVNLANTGIEISLTVVAEGVVITGLLTSGPRYFDEFSKAITSTSGGTKSLRDAIAPFIKDLEQVYSTQSDDWILAKPKFIHLREARSVTGPVHMPQMLWRGQLDKITAFSLGSVA